MAKYPSINKGNQYARDVVSGKIPACEYIQQVCQKHLDDLKNQKQANFPWKFDKDKAEKFCKFAEQMKHTKGNKWKGKFFILEPWQALIAVALFGWVWKKNGYRKYDELYLEVPRKNGKSFFSAVILLFLFCADGEAGAEIFSGAGTEKQAHAIFRPAYMMCKAQPGFKKHFGIELGGTEKNPGNIYSLKSGSRFEVVVGKPGDGDSPSGAGVDEYHEHLTDHMYDCFNTGRDAREQSLLVITTTSGTNTSRPCYAKRQSLIKALKGDISRDNVLAFIYTIDDGDDWRDFENWKYANPNYGVSVIEDNLKKKYKLALQDARKQNILKCKHLNVWSNAGESWMNMNAWQKCADPLLRLEDFEGEPCFMGLDLASKIDVAALMMIFKSGDEYFMFSRYYIPEEKTHGEDMAHYAGWVHDGYMTTTPGNRIDLEQIQNDIIELAKTYDVSGSQNGGGEVCNDPWNAQQLVTNLLNEKIGVVEVAQNVNSLSEPMKELEAVVLEGKFHHDGNPATQWMFGNVCCKVDKKDNVFPFKEGDQNKIDGAVAAITAMARAMYDDGNSGSRYNSTEEWDVFAI